MGFGLHAGKAVQGAIGSQRKLDATYISEAVLVSDSFHCLLFVLVERLCCKMDQVQQRHGIDSTPLFTILLFLYPTETCSGSSSCTVTKLQHF
mmetsp:Transcript_27023/g.27400  ORF Transcript_27023/g.27400 Transcript_27023/m.27400 type:complete len:93 (+) Transcript_27023:2-280(+)